MRILVAALVVVGSMFAAVALVSVSGIGERVHPLIVGLVLSVFFILASIAAVYFFNPWWANPLGLMRPEEVLRRLEEEGLLVSFDFQARRAFGVQEYDDEGLHYFLELTDGRVLFLSGQYLYDYEPTEDDDETTEDDHPRKEPRRFPCTDFTIRRHRTEGYVAAILCRGTALEPECFAPPFFRQGVWSEWSLEDGELISDTTYDALKAYLAKDIADRPPTGLSTA